MHIMKAGIDWMQTRYEASLWYKLTRQDRVKRTLTLVNRQLSNNVLEPLKSRIPDGQSESTRMQLRSTLRSMSSLVTDFVLSS